MTPPPPPLIPDSMLMTSSESMLMTSLEVEGHCNLDSHCNLDRFNLDLSEGAALDIANLKPEEDEDVWKRLSPQEVTLL